MKFGSVDNPENIDFTIPPDHPDTKGTLEKKGSKNELDVYVGCAKWNRADLKGFYPRGTKDELTYYATQFNSIELNATFYRIFPPETFSKWYDKTPNGFKFFPKLHQSKMHSAYVMTDLSTPSLSPALTSVSCFIVVFLLIFVRLFDV